MPRTIARVGAVWAIPVTYAVIAYLHPDIPVLPAPIRIFVVGALIAFSLALVIRDQVQRLAPPPERPDFEAIDPEVMEAVRRLERRLLETTL